MLQEVFRIPFLNIPIFGYGLMMVIGFLVAIEVAKFLAKRRGIDPEIFVNTALLALIFGVLGARLSHVLENLEQYTQATRSFRANLWDAINISNGGLTFYGGLLLATPVCIGYAIYKKLPLRIGMDVVAICVMVGLGFGRFGCFLNGCCYGAECHLPWTVQFPYDSPAYDDHVAQKKIAPPAALLNEKGRLIDRHDLTADQREIARDEHSLDVHPAQIYSVINAFLLATLLYAFYTTRPIAGRVFALMLILKGCTRFVLELLRTEPPVIGTGSEHLVFLPSMSFSMVLSIFLVLSGLVLWFYFGARGQVREPVVNSVEPVKNPRLAPAT